AEILLREDVGCDLAPLLGHEEAVETEDDRPVGVLDLAGRAAELDGVVRRLAGFGEAPRDLHECPPVDCRGRPEASRGRDTRTRRRKAPILLLLRAYLNIVAVTQLLSTIETHAPPRRDGLSR